LCNIIRGKISLNVPPVPNASVVAQSGQHVFDHFLTGINRSEPAMTVTKPVMMPE
jgi:hypothetical protein